MTAPKVRTGQIQSEHRNAVQATFDHFTKVVFSVVPVTPGHFRAAAKFVAQHPLGLRAGDALHLAVAAEHGATLYTLDRKLADAGLMVHVPTYRLTTHA